MDSNPISFWDGKLFGILGSEGPEQDGGAVGGKGSFQEVNCNFGLNKIETYFWCKTRGLCEWEIIWNHFH